MEVSISPMLPSQSLLAVSPIALTTDNVLWFGGGTLTGFVICLSIIVGVFAAVYMPKEEND